MTNLARETAAAKVLRAQLALLDLDGETLRDTIEGETNLHEAIGAVIAAITEDELLITGIEVMVQSFTERKSRLERRIEGRREAIRQAMEVGELKSITFPEASISLRSVPPKVVVLDEALIPEDFWVPQKPRLAKNILGNILKEGTAVPGATLDNGSITLAIRRS